MSALTKKVGRRISVVGISGAGKTTVARALAAGLGVPYLELDGLFHQPGWTEVDTATFRERVAETTRSEGWVIDGNYSSRVQDLVWGAADTVVWLDLPRSVVMPRLLLRTMRRMATREELWNGNRERWSNLFSLNPERNILVWSWTHHGPARARNAAALSAKAERQVVRLCSAREVRLFLREASA
jgi:adenylate kinase family enzyme